MSDGVSSGRTVMAGCGLRLSEITGAVPSRNSSERPQPGRNRHEGQVAIDDRDGFTTAQHQHDDARDPDAERLMEEDAARDDRQEAAVAIGIDTERAREMEENRAADDAEGPRGAEHLGCRYD